MPIERRKPNAPRVRCKVCDGGTIEPRRVPRFGRGAFLIGRTLGWLALVNAVWVVVDGAKTDSEVVKTWAVLSALASLAVAGLFFGLASRRSMLVCGRCRAAVEAA